MTRLGFISEDAISLNCPSDEIVNGAVAALVNDVRSKNPMEISSLNQQERLRNEISVLDAALLAVGNNILAKSAVLKKRFNDMLPIHRLPAELFTSILMMDLGEIPLWQGSRERRLWQFAQVASKWWKTVSQDTIFWTDIAFRQDDAHLYLRKSQNALLNIMCMGSKGEAAEFMEIVATASHRWKSIALSSTTGKNLVRLLQSSMPELTDMQITVRTLFDLPEEHVLQLQDLSNLKHLCLYNVGLQWGNVKLERLLSLQLANLEATAPTLDQLLAIIRSSPDLEQLALSNIRITTDGIPPLQGGICLTRLKSLQLARMPQDALEYIVMAIQSPQLTAIKLVGCPDSLFVGNPNHATEAPLMKYLPSIVGRPDEIHITNDFGYQQIQITSIPQFGKGGEWASWATSSQTTGLHITIPTENSRRSLERVITVMSEAGLREATRGRVRLCLQRCAAFEADLPDDYQGCFDAELLARLPTITHISTMDHTDTRGILQHLGQCRQGTDGTWGYSCPRLEVLDIGATNEMVERDDIDKFLSGRYGDGEPFYQGTYLVTRPPDLVDFILPSHLEEDLDEEELDEEELDESGSMEM